MFENQYYFEKKKFENKERRIFLFFIFGVRNMGRKGFGSIVFGFICYLAIPITGIPLKLNKLSRLRTIRFDGHDLYGYRTPQKIERVQ